MYRFFCSMLAILWFGLSSATVTAATRPNLLLITVDDMNADSVGVFGSAVPDTTPNIDKLAREGLRFDRAHVQVANCTPSRNVMWSGRYPHSNKVEGFYQVRDPGYETLSDFMQEGGYFTAIRHKVGSSTPFFPYNWNLVLDKPPVGERHDISDAKSYGFSTKQGINAAKLAGKPFVLLINIADPHEPFYGLNKDGATVEDAFKPSRIYKADEVSVPRFLVDDPVIREELSHYYSSVRRADDAVGYIMSALKDLARLIKPSLCFFLITAWHFPLPKHNSTTIAHGRR